MEVFYWEESSLTVTCKAFPDKNDHKNGLPLISISKPDRNIIPIVFCEKVRVGYLSEAEARRVARMILFENAVKLYRLY